MRYHYEKPVFYIKHGAETYHCNHPLYFECTLFKRDNKGLAVIQQRFNPITKNSRWGPIDECLIQDIYYHKNFWNYFKERSSESKNGLYPTVSVRQLMWALRMKPLKRERWETVFDRSFV